MESAKDQEPDRGLGNPSSRWGRRGVIASLLVGLGTLAAKSFSWFHFFPAGSGDYQVTSEWQIAGGDKGLIIAVSPHSTLEELLALGRRLRDKFHSVDNVAIMVFDDAAAAQQVGRGSRNVDEARWRAAVIHQRAMYLKSASRGENIFTIYKSYPAVAEVIPFDDDFRKTSR